jgi:hypothetical protein
MRQGLPEWRLPKNAELVPACRQQFAHSSVSLSHGGGFGCSGIGPKLFRILDLPLQKRDQVMHQVQPNLDARYRLNLGGHDPVARCDRQQRRNRIPAKSGA